MNLRGGCLIVMLIAACKRDHPCEKFADLTEKCTKERMPGSTYEELEMMCRVSNRDTPKTGYSVCANATTCAELDACFEKHECQFVINIETNRKPQFTCSLGPP